MVSNLVKIIKDEFKNMILDKGVATIMVAGIFLYSILYTIPYHNHIVREVPVGIINNDNSALSREIVRELDKSEYIKIKTQPVDLETAKKQYYKDEIKAFIVISKDFERDIKRNKGSFITAYTDSAFLTVYKQIATGINEVINTKNNTLIIGSYMKQGMSKIQAKNTKIPFEFINIPLYNPVGSYQNYIYPLVLIMILHQTMLIGIGMICGTLREKMRGTTIRTHKGKAEYIKIEKFCKFSDNSAEIVLGKSLAHVALYLVYSFLYFLIYPPLVTYQMTYKIISLLLILIPFLFSVSFLAQALIYFYKTRESALFIYIPSSVPIVFLLGFIWPNEAINPILRLFATCIPAVPGADALLKINQMGADFFQVHNDFWILILQCLLYYSIACWGLNRQQSLKIY